MQLVLGTVQFGLAYGVAGRPEPVPEAEVRDILRLAFERGIRTLDTAAAYGDIESRLARLCGDLPFSVVSKLPALPAELDDAGAATWFEACADRSLAHLGPRLTTLMFHSAADLNGPRGERLWSHLSAWADRHRVTLGASCYGPDEALALHRRFGASVMQLPGNALDQRLRGSTLLQAGGPRLHLRSAFLQGLLLMPLDQATARVPAAAASLQRWHAWLHGQGLAPVLGALSVVKGLGPLEACVIGVDGVAHLDDITQAWAQARGMAAPSLACELPDAIDPRRWSARS